VLTVFSAPNYCGCVGNLGAVLQINGRCTTELYTFEEVAGVEQLPSNYYFCEWLAAGGSLEGCMVSCGSGSGRGQFVLAATVAYVCTGRKCSICVYLQTQ
jgi:hypothetical protein